MNLKHYEERAEIKASWKTTKPPAEFSEPVRTCAYVPLHYCSSIFALAFDLLSFPDTCFWASESMRACPGWTHQRLSPICIKYQAHGFSLGTLPECRHETSTSHGGILIFLLLLREKRERQIFKKCSMSP